MSAVRRLALPAVLLASLVLASPGIATVIVEVRPGESRGLLVNVGGSGSDLRITAERNGSGQVTNLVVRDESGAADFVPFGPCQEGVAPFTNQMFVRCSAPMLPFVEFSSGGDFRDSLELTSGVGNCLCDGGPKDDRIVGADGADFIQGGRGNDVLRGGSDDDVLEGEDGADNIDGGAGDDTLRGGAGNDEFVTGTGADGADSLDGGDGVDAMNYGPRVSRLQARIDGSANDGTLFRAGSEGDNIQTTVENVTGGTGSDVLEGSPESNTLLGGSGNDTVRGGSGNDTLDGGLGSDLLQGQLGEDRLKARDSVDDQAGAAISCGPGTEDILDADVRDDDTRALPVDCETASQGMVDEHPNVRIRSVRRAGPRALVVRLRCPRSTRNGCAGSLLAGSPRKRAGFGPAKRYRIRRGAGKAVRVRVRRPSQALRRRQARIRSVERGRLGRRTTLRTLTVR